MLQLWIGGTHCQGLSREGQTQGQRTDLCTPGAKSRRATGGMTAVGKEELQGVQGQCWAWCKLGHKSLEWESPASVRKTQTAETVEINLGQKLEKEETDGFSKIRDGQRDGFSKVHAGQADEFTLSTKRNTWKNRKRTSVTTTDSGRNKFDALASIQGDRGELC